MDKESIKTAEVLEAEDLFDFLWEGPLGCEMNIEHQYDVLEDGEEREFEHGKARLITKR